MSSLVKHIVLILLGLCGVLILQTFLLADGPNAAHLILAAASIGTVIVAFAGASQTHRHRLVWIAAPVAIYAAVLLAMVMWANPLSVTMLAACAAAILLMAGTAWFSVRSARLVDEVDELGALLLFEGQLKSANAPDDFRLCGEKLLAQCHRQHRPLAVIAVEWRIVGEPENAAGSAIEARLARHLQRRELVAGINDNLRTSDLMLSGERTNLCYLVCPDTDLASAMGYCARLDTAITERLPAEITFGVAHFGEAGYSLEELIAAAAERLAGALSRPAPQAAPGVTATLPELVPSPVRNWSRTADDASLTKTAG